MEIVFLLVLIIKTKFDSMVYLSDEQLGKDSCWGWWLESNHQSQVLDIHSFCYKNSLHSFIDQGKLGLYLLRSNIFLFLTFL